MAKIARPKQRQLSKHSRAARRAVSPSLNFDKSLKSLPPPSAKPNPTIISAHEARITKKRKQKPLSKAQRLRQQKGMERADANFDKLEQKVKESEDRAKKMKARRVAWDDINGKAPDEIVIAQTFPQELKNSDVDGERMKPSVVLGGAGAASAHQQSLQNAEPPSSLPSGDDNIL